MGFSGFRWGASSDRGISADLPGEKRQGKKEKEVVKGKVNN